MVIYNSNTVMNTRMHSIMHEDMILTINVHVYIIYHYYFYDHTKM